MANTTTNESRDNGKPAMGTIAFRVEEEIRDRGDRVCVELGRSAGRPVQRSAGSRRIYERGLAAYEEELGLAPKKTPAAASAPARKRA